MGEPRLFKRADSPNWYTTVAGRSVSTGCRDKRAAGYRAAELERAAYAPRTAPDAPPLREALAAAREDRRLGLTRRAPASEGTLHMWGIKGGHLARILGDETPIDVIDAARIDAYTAQRLGEGAARSTIGKELSVLSVVLGLARRHRQYPYALDEVMPKGWGSDYVPRKRALSPEELGRLLADLMNDDLPMMRGRAGPPRQLGSKRSRRDPLPPKTSSYERTRHRSMKNRAAQVAFIVATGARWSESERARREDVDWSTGLVLVRGSKTPDAWDHVPILATTAPLLRIALEHGREEGELFEPWQNVRRDLHAVCRRLGIAPVSPNDLRRTTGTELRERGVEPHLIGKVLRHVDSRMAERVYASLANAGALKRLLEERVGGAVPLLPVATKGKRRTG